MAQLNLQSPVSALVFLMLASSCTLGCEREKSVVPNRFAASPQERKEPAKSQKGHPGNEEVLKRRPDRFSLVSKAASKNGCLIGFEERLKKESTTKNTGHSASSKNEATRTWQICLSPNGDAELRSNQSESTKVPHQNVPLLPTPKGCQVHSAKVLGAKNLFQLKLSLRCKSANGFESTKDETGTFWKRGNPRITFGTYRKHVRPKSALPSVVAYAQDVDHDGHVDLLLEVDRVGSAKLEAVFFDRPAGFLLSSDRLQKRFADLATSIAATKEKPGRPSAARAYALYDLFCAERPAFSFMAESRPPQACSSKATVSIQRTYALELLSTPARRVEGFSLARQAGLLDDPKLGEAASSNRQWERMSIASITDGTDKEKMSLARADSGDAITLFLGSESRAFVLDPSSAKVKKAPTPATPKRKLYPLHSDPTFASLGSANAIAQSHQGTLIDTSEGLYLYRKGQLRSEDRKLISPKTPLPFPLHPSTLSSRREYLRRTPLGLVVINLDDGKVRRVLGKPPCRLQGNFDSALSANSLYAAVLCRDTEAVYFLNLRHAQQTARRVSAEID